MADEEKTPDVPQETPAPAPAESAEAPAKADAPAKPEEQSSEPSEAAAMLAADEAPGTHPEQDDTVRVRLDALQPGSEYGAELVLIANELIRGHHQDPRAGVAHALVDVLGRDDAPVLAYSNYEKRCLTEMAEHLPELAEALGAIADRLVDLLPILRKHVYHPDLLGSFSIKQVAPAFASDVGYGDLSGVADGMAALGAFSEVIAGTLSSKDEERVRRELLAYCGRDTLALLEVFRAVQGAASHRAENGQNRVTT